MNKQLSSISDDRQRPMPDTLSTNGQPDGTSSGLSVLLIDDNGHVAESLAVAVRLAGHTLDWADGPETALSHLAVRPYDVFLLDMNYTAGRTDGKEGLTLLRRILTEDPSARVVVITAHSGIQIAVEAMRAGACDFVMKPWRNGDLTAKLERAAAAKVSSTQLISEPSRGAAPRLIGESAAMIRVRDLVRRVGPTTAGVVITGASGSGRSLVARALHAISTRSSEPMVRVDLRDAEGWDHIGDNCGTLLLRYPERLDEVKQARLLDRLRDETRVIAIADNAAAIRPALSMRVATVEIALPPLSARGHDALLLARHFARSAAERYGRPVPSLTAAAEAAVLHGDWPQQVRGLAAAIERAVLLNESEEIDAALLLPPTSPATLQDISGPTRFDLEKNERIVIEAALREHHHNVSHAATALGLSRGTLYRRMERHGL